MFDHSGHLREVVVRQVEGAEGRPLGCVCVCVCVCVCAKVKVKVQVKVTVRVRVKVRVRVRVVVKLAMCSTTAGTSVKWLCDRVMGRVRVS